MSKCGVTNNLTPQCYVWISPNIHEWDEKMSQGKVKDTALDFTVHTGGADLRFLALQPGSAMGGWGPAILCFRTPFLLPSPDFSRYPFRAGSTLAKLTESRRWPLSQTEDLGTPGFEPESFQTKDPESSAPIRKVRFRGYRNFLGGRKEGSFEQIGIKEECV